jgi:hypothetical protein
VSIVAVVEVNVVISPLVADKLSALTVVQVNVQSDVILPTNSTSPLTVCRVTLDKSKFS